MEKKIITFGEIMLRLATPGNLRFSQATEFNATFGGGEANVAVSLANYGMATEFVTRLPQNDIAKSALMNLRKYGVGTNHIIMGGERVGIYFLETGSIARPSKVIYDRAGSSISEITPGMINWREVFKEACWFHWTGITPALSQGAADTCFEAITIAKEMGVTVSVDLNYRKNLWNYGKPASQVMPKLVSECDIILGNEEDAHMIFGIKPRHFDVAKIGSEISPQDFEPVCKEIALKFAKSKKIVITLRGSVNANHNKWAGVMYDRETFYHSKIYDLTHIVDRVGAGDSFMGGLIYGLLKHAQSNKKTLDFAVAASALKHTIYGDFNLATIEEIERVISGDESGRVTR